MSVRYEAAGGSRDGRRASADRPAWRPWWILAGAVLVSGCGSGTEDGFDDDQLTRAASEVPALPARMIESVVSVTAVDGRTLTYRRLRHHELGAGDEWSALRFYHIDVRTAADLEALLASPAWQSGPPMSAASLPPDLGDLEAPQKKALFFQTLLPMVAFHNRVAASQQRRLQELEGQERLTGEERLFLEAMGRLYRLEDLARPLRTRGDTVRVLLRRAGAVPPSLALAQAAIESGWGSSRFSRQGNNLFGQRVWGREAGGLQALGAPGARFRLATFPTVSASVHSYMRNLNTHAAYGEFRALRLRMRPGTADPIRLARTLEAYSTRREAYTRDLVRMIRSNDLTRFDDPARTLPEPAQ